MNEIFKEKLDILNVKVKIKTDEETVNVQLESEINGNIGCYLTDEQVSNINDCINAIYDNCEEALKTYIENKTLKSIMDEKQGDFINILMNALERMLEDKEE